MTVKSGGTALKTGTALKIVNADDQLEPAGAGDKTYAVLGNLGLNASDGTRKDFPASTTKKTNVILIGVVKVLFGGAVTRNDPVKAGASGKFVAAVNTVTIPSGATAVTSTSAQPSMTVEGGIACGIAQETIAADLDEGLIIFGRN